MLLPLVGAALGWALNKHRLSASDRCTGGCTDGFDRGCTEQDEAGEWTRGCTYHPTTNCNEDCSPFPPPPPLVPWLGADGSYPSPPPATPPPRENPLLPWAIATACVAAVFLLFFACVLMWHCGGSARAFVTYWCCCVMAFVRPGDADGGVEGGEMQPALQGTEASADASEAPDALEPQRPRRVRFSLPPVYQLPTLAFGR
jgi:hypothetical protein